jgi:hypothetical protein
MITVPPGVVWFCIGVKLMITGALLPEGACGWLQPITTMIDKSNMLDNSIENFGILIMYISPPRQ